MQQNHTDVKTHTRYKSKKGKLFSIFLKETTFGLLGLSLLISAIFVIWIATIKLPDFNDFENRKISNSTKIYDRSGKIVLYNIHDNIKRTAVVSGDINYNIKRAAIAIEDSHFYDHYGIRPQSILRAVIVNIMSGHYAQGGSTITQQVVKNALLTSEKSIIRKMKEWILAVKLDAQVSKDDIITIYLNESPYGGSIYGVEEASVSYFGKHAKDLSLVESAYLAAIPQAPSYYSPYGNHRDALEIRKNLVLSRMYELEMITKQEYDEAVATKTTFEPQESSNGRAWHFVFYVREYLESKYGKDVVENGGLKVITTLDARLQAEAEKIVHDGAIENKKKYNAENAALVAINPKNGEILSMVGSRGYFDKEIDGQFNIATALRQPGSAFKPIVYSLAFSQGYTPDTVIFDLPTQFSTRCDPYGNPLNGGNIKNCYMPVNYDGTFRGPVSLRKALQLSLNVPAVKLQYLVGVKNTLNYAKNLGINSLNDSSRFGLSLALGGGEVSLLELTGAYATFANEGVYNKPVSVLEVDDNQGNVLEKVSYNPRDVLPAETANTLADVLTDNNARAEEFGLNSALFFNDRPVAVKTGTSNDYRDVWVVGYTPSIAVGMWAGNNDNTPINKKIAGFVVAPVWHKFMDVVFKNTPIEYFPAPPVINTDTLPVLRGVYCPSGDISTILKFIGGMGNSVGGYNDSQYNLWDTPIKIWATTHTCPFYTNQIDPNSTSTENIPVVENVFPEPVVNTTNQ